MHDVKDRIVADLNRVVRLPHVRRTVPWCSYERTLKRSINCFIHVGDKFVCRNGVTQMQFDVRDGTIQFFNERRADVKRVLFSEHRDAP